MSMMRASKVGFLGCLKAPHPRVSICRRRIVCRRTLRPLHAKQVQEQEIEQVDDKTEALTEEPEVERVTKKWGLEAGLWKVDILHPDALKEFFFRQLQEIRIRIKE